jgi:two-component system chemotaxis response regulator CheY
MPDKLLTEKQLLDYIAHDGKSISWHVLHIQTHLLQPANIEKNFSKLLQIIHKQILPFPYIKSYFSTDKDMYLLITEGDVDVLIGLIVDTKQLFLEDPLIANDSELYFSANPSENDKHFFIHYQQNEHQEPLTQLLQQKSQIRDNIHPKTTNNSHSLDGFPIESLQLKAAMKDRKVRKVFYGLVIEDHPFSKELMVDVFGTVLGHHMPDKRILSAENGPDALVQYAHYAPNMVLLDINLPKYSGHEILSYIQKIDPLAYIIMISANSFADDVKRAAQLGASGFIAKPFTRNKLVHYVESYFNHHKPKDI